MVSAISKQPRVGDWFILWAGQSESGQSNGFGCYEIVEFSVGLIKKHRRGKKGHQLKWLMKSGNYWKGSKSDKINRGGWN